MYGFTDKENLTKWNAEDAQKAKNCEWMLREEFQPPEGSIKRYFYVTNWHKRLCESLPTPEVNELYKQLDKFSIFGNLSRFEKCVRFARYDMVQKILAYQYQKQSMFREYAKKPTLDLESKESTMERYRIEKLTTVFPYGSACWEMRKSQNVQGYIPTYDILMKFQPIEVIEYAGHKLIKYDKFYNYFAAIIVYPKEWNMESQVIFNENPNVVELKSDNLFEVSIDKYLKQKSNPYGDKSYEQIDISNVTNMMNGTNDPLNNDIF